MVIDVGANEGQYGQELRRAGYRAHIASFEPMAAAFAALETICSSDSRWMTYRIALGSAEGTSTLHVTKNSASSSVLPMLPLHVRCAPDSAVLGDEDITIRRLDGLVDSLLTGHTSPFLKADVQGYELEVMLGAGSRLAVFSGLELELSFVPLYRGSALITDILDFTRSAGYDLVGLTPGLADDRSGMLLQADGLFVRRDLIPELLQ